MDKIGAFQEENVVGRTMLDSGWSEKAALAKVIPFDGVRAVAISYSEIISALTYAIDLTEGAVPGHALRSCVLGMRVAEQMGVPRWQMQSLYYALLLKDIGCSSNAARMCQIVGGDDRVMKNEMKMEDAERPHRSRRETLKVLWREVLPEARMPARVWRIMRIGLHRKRNTQELIELRCDRGAAIARKLGLSAETSAAIHGLDEHWDGLGYPGQKAGREIPLLARVLAVAQHLDVFASEQSARVAMEVLKVRSGSWFDPAVVKAAAQLHEHGVLWDGCRCTDDEAAVRRVVLGMEPYGAQGVAEEEIDLICEAFADVVDAKSPFTYRHSIGVAEVAVGIAGRLGLPVGRQQVVRRAALLHDVGKLSVPNTILDKKGALTAGEWKVVGEHSRLTRRILERIESFAEIAVIAGAHHERLDGTGYPDKLTGAEMGVEARIVAVADVYSALTEERPYRAGMGHVEAMGVMGKMVPGQLDAGCVAALGRETSTTADADSLWE